MSNVTASKRIQRQQVDDLLQSWRALPNRNPPRDGWLKTIRQSLGMTTRQLAERLGVNQSRIVRIEQTEISGTTSLKALKAAANAMDCELIYAVVPKKTLQEILEERAYRRAEGLVRRVLQNMSLEDQSPSKRSADEMIRARTKELLDGSSRRLWERDKP